MLALLLTVGLVAAPPSAQPDAGEGETVILDLGIAARKAADAFNVSYSLIRGQAGEEARALGPNHAWAGTYRSGSGGFQSFTLTLAPRTGFLFEARTCLLSNRSYGSIADDGDRLALRTVSSTPRGLLDAPRELVLVRQGGRIRYLVDATKVKDFCNAANAGVMTSSGSFYRRVEENTPGKPRDSDREDDPVRLEIPARYESCLLAAPIRARIVSVGEVTRKPLETGDGVTLHARVKIDAGRADGIWEGMYLRIEDDPFLRALPLVVESLGEHTAEARFEGFRMNEDGAPPSVGGWVSTRWTAWFDH